MRLLTATSLTESLWEAANILRGSIDYSEYLDVISRMLILKRASDQPDFLRVPDDAQWSHIIGYRGRELGHVLDQALRQLERSNLEVLDGVLDDIDFSRRFNPSELQALINHFDRISLRDDALEFNDVVGLAFNSVIRRFGDRVSRRGGELYTPASIVELMVRLVKPHEGQSVYDPFAGSGGMLVQAKQYVDEHGGIGTNLSFFGQEKNASTCSIARLNLLLNGVNDGSILCDDTLVRPLHTAPNGQLRLFDRVLTNPPFSMTYDKRELSHPERMKYGWTPKQADLMNVQHVLAVLRPTGIGAVVTPQGLLFRGGAEAEIRRGIIEDGRVEAVIGIGANVFHGTALPACILMLRGKDGLPEGRRDSVLFINAEREVASGRTQNRLEAAHVEKIVRAFRNWSSIPGYSRVVSLREIVQNDFNLNIRRYVRAGAHAEMRLDVLGALFGGVPKREVQREAPRFKVFGINLIDLFRIRNADYLDFLPEGYEVTAERTQELAAPREYEFLDHFRRWWERAGIEITELAETGSLITLRPVLMNSFCTELLPQGILDQYQLTGVLADWWFDHHDDFRSLGLRGFAGVIDRWAMTRRFQALHATEQSAHHRVLDMLGDDLRSRVERLVFAKRQELADTYRSWGERYATSLVDLEKRRDVVAARFKARMEELGHPNHGSS